VGGRSWCVVGVGWLLIRDEGCIGRRCSWHTGGLGGARFGIILGGSMELEGSVVYSMEVGLSDVFVAKLCITLWLPGAFLLPAP
jgi:hypothetical protein